MDECDLAGISNDFYLDLVTRKRPRPGISENGESSEVCLECGNDIPLARREAMPGCTLCVDCQTELETEI